MFDVRKTSLPPKWAIEFTMALRSRDVTGAAIGDALRAAEAFCADSGQTPEEAFGPAPQYADSLTDLPTVAGGATWTTRLGPSALGLAGLTLALPTFDAWRAGHDVQLGLGHVLAVLLTLTTVLVLVARPRIYRTRTLFGLVLAVGFLGSGVLSAWLVAIAAHLPVWPCALAAIGALLGSGLWQMRVLDPDVIVDPLAPPLEHSRTLRLMTAWLFPLLTALALVLGSLLPPR